MLLRSNAARLVMLSALVFIGSLAAEPLAQASRAPQAASATSALPARLSDADFWTLTTDISEPGGYFRITDNYTSNENEVGSIVNALRERGSTGGVYVGVGPEQNFSYIAATRPAMAFVIDIRRQAVMQHLMFKAMFELSKDRAEFLSMLFAKPRPQGLDANTPIQKIWEAYFTVLTDRTAAAAIAERVVKHLTVTHKFTFTSEEQAQLDAVLAAFVQFGPGITTRGSMNGGGGGNNWSFADLTGWSTDELGRPQSFLSSEEHFQTVKALHDKNLIVAVSGDFGGPKALRAIGSYIREHGSTLSAFYVSNVEQYLFMDGKQQAFFDNVALMPLTDKSVFIRPYAMRKSVGPPLCGIAAFLKAAKGGRVYSNNEALACVS